MNLSDLLVKVAGIILVVFGVFVLISTNFGAFDIAFALHFIGGLVLIGAGVILVRGGNISL